MRALILTCNTGGGHNSSARAIHEAFAEKGHYCEIADAIRFVSEKLSDFLEWGHTTMYRHIPALFRVGYGFAEKHPAMLEDEKAVYKLLTDGTKQLYNYIQAGKFDTVICPHVFSGLLLRQTLKEYPLRLKTAFVATDYTCSPGAAKCELDRYFIPAELLRKEYVRQGVPADRIIASGIPIGKEFYTASCKEQARSKLGIDPTHKHILMMFGSMGCGPMEKLTKLLSKQLEDDTYLSIICGTNKKLRKELEEKFGACPNIRIHGFVQNISLIMDSADLYLTKPGGLSSTEASAKKLPMVLFDTVAGCEEHNLNFFVSLGGAVAADSPEELARQCTWLIENPAERSAMSDALASALPRNAAVKIFDALNEM